MDILQQLNQIAQERDLSLDELQLELEKALAEAYKKHIQSIRMSNESRSADVEVKVSLDPTKGWTAEVQKEVVAIVGEPSYQISLAEARRRDPNAEVGDFIPAQVDPNRFGRIAAIVFKQVLSHKVREAEHRHIQEVFNEKMGEISS